MFSDENALRMELTSNNRMKLLKNFHQTPMENWENLLGADQAENTNNLVRSSIEVDFNNPETITFIQNAINFYLDHPDAFEKNCFVKFFTGVFAYPHDSLPADVSEYSNLFSEYGCYIKSYQFINFLSKGALVNKLLESHVETMTPIINIWVCSLPPILAINIIFNLFSENFTVTAQNVSIILKTCKNYPEEKRETNDGFASSYTRQNCALAELITVLLGPPINSALSLFEKFRIHSPLRTTALRAGFFLQSSATNQLMRFRRQHFTPNPQSFMWYGSFSQQEETSSLLSTEEGLTELAALLEKESINPSDLIAKMNDLLDNSQDNHDTRINIIIRHAFVQLVEVMKNSSPLHTYGSVATSCSLLL